MDHYKATGSLVGFNSTIFNDVDLLDNKWFTNEAIVNFEGKQMKLGFSYDEHNYLVVGALIKNKYLANIICDNKLAGNLNSMVYLNEKGFILYGCWAEGFMINGVWGRFDWVDKKEVYVLN